MTDTKKNVQISEENGIVPRKLHIYQYIMYVVIID